MNHDIKGIIFLDISGPLLTLRNAVKFSKEEFDPECVENLIKICDETGSKVVIHSNSSHKRNKSSDELIEWFSDKDVRLRNYIIDKTPDTGFNKEKEIKKWLDEAVKTNRYNIANSFVIIDDERYELVPYFDHLVQVSNIYGINEDVVKRVINLFNELKDKPIEVPECRPDKKMLDIGDSILKKFGRLISRR